MKILIVGEFSGFAKHLKKGFNNLGHQVTIVMTPDSFKKFTGDDDDILYNDHWVIFGKQIKGTQRLPNFRLYYQITKKLNKIYRKSFPDIIIVINYCFISTGGFRPGTPLNLIRRFIKNGSKLIMSACGSDPALQFAYKDLCEYVGFRQPIRENRFSFLLKNADAIIPTCYCYYYAIKKYIENFNYKNAKLKNSIPLPITLQEKPSITSCVGRKIVIFHGVTRPKVKGTPFIKSAMEKLQEDYPDKVECLFVKRLPYNEYVELFEKVDILIDQTNFNGWGMNAQIGAMKGKCVLAPCGEENGENMGIDNIPFVKIGPNSEQIYNTLVMLIENPQRLDEIKRESHRFVEEYCDSILIAQKYIEVLYNPKRQ